MVTALAMFVNKKRKESKMKKMNRIFFQIVALAMFLSSAFSNAFAQGSMCINAYMVSEESCSPGNDGIAAVFIPTALSGHCTIEWQLGQGQTSSSEMVSGLTRGTYHVTVRSNTCPNVVFYNGSVTITRNEECEVSVSITCSTSGTANCNEIPPVTCTAIASGGTPPYTFSGWNQVSSGVATKTIYPGEGHYSVSCIVRDANGNYGAADVDGYAKKMQCAQDPNEIRGPAGYGEEERFVNKSDKMNYTIDFENDPDFAMAPASRVKITYDVPDQQRLASFRLADFGFGDFIFTVPSNAASYSQRLDVADSLGVWVDVTAGIDIVHHQVFWTFQSIDPATGAEPSSSQMGFLPINDSIGHGQGYVSFYITPETTVQTGDTVAAEAIIVFDDNAPIGTNVWVNTFDAGNPSSRLHLETNAQDSLYCTFSFEAQDDVNGSGVQSVAVYVSVNNADYFSLGSVHPDSIFTYALENGVYYQFMSIATDNVGNIEPFKSQPDTSINYNTAPIDLILSGNSFYEYDPINTEIGTLYTLDNDVNLPFVYELVAGEGDEDNNLFVLEGNSLRTNNTFTCSRRTEYSVRIRTTDIGGLYFEKSFALTEVMQHETPVTRLNKTVCEGSSIDFYGRPLTEEGTYTDTLPTVDGCDSIIIWYLRVTPVYNLSEEETICQSDLPYTWRDTIFGEGSVTGDYVFHRSTINGCDSIVTLHLTVNPVVVMDAVTDQTLCHNDEMTAVNFSTSLTGGTMSYNWIRDNEYVTGVAANGTGNIVAMALANPTDSAQTVTFTVTPTYTYNNVACTGDSITFTVTVNPQVVMNTVDNQTICSGGEMTAVSFGTTLTDGTISYSWTRDHTTDVTGIAASGTGDIDAATLVNTTNAAQTVTFTVTPTYSNNGISCVGANTTFTVTVNPQVVMNTVDNQVVCSGSATEAVTFSTTLTDGTMTYSWTRDNTTDVTGMDAEGTGDIEAATLSNLTNEAQTVTFTVTPTYNNGNVSCTGASTTFTVTVLPQVVMNTVGNQTLCSGSEIAAVNFSTTLTDGTMTYNWTRDHTTDVTGMNAEGTGDIAAATLNNTTTEAQTVTFTVTPTYTNGNASCTGEARTFTVTVLPQVVMNTVDNQTLCSGSATEAVTFSTTLTDGTMSYSWTRDNDNITGFETSGTGNIDATTLVNTTNAAQTVTFTVTPTYSNSGINCVGDESTFTVTVLPQVAMNTVDNQTLCSGSEIAAVNFSTTVTDGTMTYNWTRDHTTDVTGMNAEGTGDIAAATLNNTTTEAQTVTFTVTPTYTNGNASCTGEARTFTVTVLPQVVMNTVDNQTLCSGGQTEAISFSTTLTDGTMSYSWTRDNDNITGFETNGTGNIDAVTLVNTTNAAQTVTFTVTPTYTNSGISCVGDEITFTVKVNPQVVMDSVFDQHLCNFNQLEVTFGTTLTDGTMTYNWSRDNENILGIASSGPGDIMAILENTANSAQTINFTVTPTYTNNSLNCYGAERFFVVTVNPQVVMNTVDNQTVCSGDEMAAVNFSTTLTDGEMSYGWYRNNMENVTGVDVYGTGDIVATTMVNLTSEPQTVTFTVTPSYLNNGISCEGTSTFTVTVNPVYSQTESATICQSDLPYSWRDTIFRDETVSGDYVFNKTSINGCDSIVTLHLTVNSTTYGDTSAIACDRFTWYDSTYTESGDYLHTFANSNVMDCDSVVTLHLTVNHSTFGDTAAIVCDRFTWYDSTYTESGDYPHTFFNGNANGCDSTVTLHLTVNPIYDLPLEANICESDLPYHYVNGQIDTTFGVGTPAESVILFSFSTGYDCDSTVTLTLTVNPSYTSDTPIEDTICETDLPYNYVNGQIDTTFELGTPAESTVSFTLSTVNGCDSVVTLHLVVTPCDTTGIVGYDGGVFALYPNPTSSLINVQCVLEGMEWKNAEIQLFDAFGRRLKIVPVTGEITTLDLSRYATGVYFVKLVNDGKIIAVRKAVKR